MQWFPHSDESEELMGVELWVGVATSGRSPVTWASVKGALRAMKPRVKAWHQAMSSQMKPEPSDILVLKGDLRLILVA